MDSEGCDDEGLSLRDASDREFESDLTIGMGENTTVSEGDFDRRTWLSGETE